MTNKCENPECDNDAQMDVHMPLLIGMFRADMCMQCGLLVQDNIDTVMEIIKKRASARGIKLPTTPDELKKLCEVK